MKIISLLTFLCATSFVDFVGIPVDERTRIAAEMKYSMESELLNAWYPKAVDSLYGGFLSEFTYDFKQGDNQDKMIVTQARHIWSNARAAELYPQKACYKKSAEQAFHFSA